MKRVLATNLIIGIVVLISFLAYRQHKNVQNAEVRQSMIPELVTKLAESGMRLTEYRGSSTKLWTDRDYSTREDVRELHEKHFVRLPRNAGTVYLLRVKENTTLYTLANQKDLHGIAGWTVLDAPVLVEDVIPHRVLDGLFAKEVIPGAYVIRPRSGGPAQPIFFDRNAVEVVVE